MKRCFSGPVLHVFRAFVLLLFAAVPVALPAAGSESTASSGDDPLRNAEIAIENRDLVTAAREFAAAAAVTDDPSVAERAAQFTFNTGFDAFAETSVRRWLELMPDSPLPNEVMGRLLLRRHAIDEAVTHFTRALGPSEPRRDEVYLALAADLANENDARLVTRALARLTAQDPMAPGLQLALGTAALRSGDHALALFSAESAAIDDPDWKEPSLLAARALAGLGREDDALKQLATISDPENPFFELERARMLADLGRTADSRLLLETLEGRLGERPEITRTLAFLDLAEGDLDSAERRLDREDLSGAERFEAFFYRAQIAASRSEHEAARGLYERISSGAYLVPAQIEIAESYVAEGNPEAALEQLVRFAADHPAQAYDVLSARAHLLHMLERWDEELAIYDEALVFKPAALPVLLSRGALLERLGRIPEALADLRRATEIAPDDPAALNAYGYTLANRTSQTREAWHYVRRALEIAPESAPIQDSVGWTLYKSGRHQEARSHLEEAFTRMPDPEIGSHLAEVWWMTGERERATDLLQAVAVGYPDSEVVTDAVQRLLK